MVAQETNNCKCRQKPTLVADAGRGEQRPGRVVPEPPPGGAGGRPGRHRTILAMRNVTRRAAQREPLTEATWADAAASAAAWGARLAARARTKGRPPCCQAQRDRRSWGIVGGRPPRPADVPFLRNRTGQRRPRRPPGSCRPGLSVNPLPGRSARCPVRAAWRPGPGDRAARAPGAGQARRAWAASTETIC